MLKRWCWATHFGKKWLDNLAKRLYNTSINSKEAHNMIINEIQNITVQLRKSFDVNANYDIVFQNGDQSKLSLDQINRYLDIYTQVKPFQKEIMQNKAIKSLADFLEIIK